MSNPSNPPIDALPLICAVQDNLARRLVRQPELVSLAQSHGFSWEATDRLARASWLLLRRIDQGFAPGGEFEGIISEVWLGVALLRGSTDDLERVMGLHAEIDKELRYFLCGLFTNRSCIVYGKRNPFDPDWVALPLADFEGSKLTVRWSEGSILINNVTLYNVRVLRGKPAADVQVEESNAEEDASKAAVAEGDASRDCKDATGGVVPPRKRRGRRPELKIAILQVFAESTAEGERAISTIDDFTEEERRDWVSGRLSLPEDERPSRSYVTQTWKIWKQQNGHNF